MSLINGVLLFIACGSGGVILVLCNRSLYERYMHFIEKNTGMHYSAGFVNLAVIQFRICGGVLIITAGLVLYQTVFHIGEF